MDLSGPWWETDLKVLKNPLLICHCNVHQCVLHKSSQVVCYLKWLIQSLLFPNERTNVFLGSCESGWYNHLEIKVSLIVACKSGNTRWIVQQTSGWPLKHIQHVCQFARLPVFFALSILLFFFLFCTNTSVTTLSCNLIFSNDFAYPKPLEMCVIFSVQYAFKGPKTMKKKTIQSWLTWFPRIGEKKKNEID